MKSKIKANQILMKGMAILLSIFFVVSPIAYATTSLDDSYLESSIIDKILYGAVGSTAKEIEKYLVDHVTLYICNEIQLRALAEYVNDGHDCSGKQIKVINNIEVNSQEEWIPIGTEANPFKGIFDGSEYTISGIRFYRGEKFYSEITNIGLFGYVSGNGAIIKNIKLSDSIFYIPYDIEIDLLNRRASTKIENYTPFEYSYNSLGGIVGFNNEAIIEDCIISSNVEINGLENVGGIVGTNLKGTVANCENTSKVNGFTDVGGIVGYNIGENNESTTVFSKNKVAKVINCRNMGEIYALNGDAGGIVGCQIYTSIIQKSENSGNINIGDKKYNINENQIIEPENAGGIVGWFSGGINKGASVKYYSLVEGCINNGAVNGYRDIGGISGQTGGMFGGYAILSNCINYSMSVRSSIQDSEFGEVGFLSGEVGSYVGSEESGNELDSKNRSSVGILYNNIYVLENKQIDATGSTGNSYEEKAQKCDNDLLNKSTNTYILGYGTLANYAAGTTELWKDYNNTTSIMLYANNTYSLIGTEIDKENMHPIGDTGDNKIEFTSITGENISIPINTNSVIYSNNTSSKMEILKNSGAMQVLDSNTGVTVGYQIINNKQYYKAGDKIEVKVIFNKKLYNGQLNGTEINFSAISNPKILIEEQEMEVNSIVEGKEYKATYTVKGSDENRNLESLAVSLVDTNVYASESKEDNITSKNKEIDISNDNISIDIKGATVTTTAYVENELETQRYTAGKEILINVTTNEQISYECQAPKMQISFLESGIGKYNYSSENITVGYAKVKESKINLDGTVTWIYSYQIQEGDEGKLKLQYINGKITDLAGNETNLNELENINATTENVQIDNIELIGGTTANLSYKFYKGNTQITDFTKLTKFLPGDRLKVVATFDKSIYTQFGSTASGASNIKALSENDVPVLKIDNNSMDCTEVIVNIDQNTTITYEYIIPETITIARIDDLTMTTNAYYYTDANQSINNTDETNKANVLISGKTINKNIAGLNLVFCKSDMQVNTNNIYADTTVPTVNIKTIKSTFTLAEESNLDNVDIINAIDKSDFNQNGKIDFEDVMTLFNSTSGNVTNIQCDIDNDGDTDTKDSLLLYQWFTGKGTIGSITNSDSLIYFFEVSEYVEGFTEDDITINGGRKEGNLETLLDGKMYALKVIPDVANGNIGELQVIVEQSACKDLVALANSRAESVITIDRKVPELEIIPGEKTNNGRLYTFRFNEAVRGFEITDIKLNGNVLTEESGELNGEGSEYTLTLNTADTSGQIVTVESGVCYDIAGNGNIKAEINTDKIAPILTIKIKTNNEENSDVNSTTNESSLIYFFEWSEEIEGFSIDDIIVNGGTKGRFAKVTETISTYTLEVTPDVAEGNVGELQVIVESDKCKDLAGNSNARTESVIVIDRIAPILMSLEAYATSELNNNITVKQYYKTGDVVTVIATFNESIVNTTTVQAPILNLQFSESGDAKGTVIGVKDGNKITYTYTIDDEDNGILSIKAFNGQVQDVTGNITVVTKRNLEGNNIIADAVAPELLGVSVIAPEFKYEDLLANAGETKRYGIGEQITFVASYNESVYYATSEELVEFNADNAPKLKFKFGNTERVAQFKEVKGNEIYYTYEIQDGDNGNLSISSIVGNVYDEAENITTSIQLKNILLYEKEIKEENKIEKITSDTIKPVFEITASGINKDDAGNVITVNTANFFRKGSIITIEVKSNEFVYKENSGLSNFIDKAPNISLKFGDNTAKSNAVFREVTYGDSETIFNYEYIIQDGDNGQLKITIPENSVADIALNKNVVVTDREITIVIADTINPTYEDSNGDIQYSNGEYTVTFNEDLYSLSENNRVGNPIAPVLKFENSDEEYTGTVSGKVITYVGAQMNSKPYLGSSRLCDKAGNMYSYYDNKAPTLTNFEVISPETGTYKAGTEVMIVATFSENVVGTVPTILVTFGDGVSRNISNGVIVDNTVTYNFQIIDTDNGELYATIGGAGLRDASGNEWQVPQNTTLNGNRITADNIAPTLTIMTNVEKTNKDTVTYIFTWSEDVREFTQDDIEVTNGLKGRFTKINNSKYELIVDTTNEGRQIVKVAAGVCLDIAGNLNTERATYNKVVIDYTKPVIRAKVNGGNYVIDTDSEKSLLKEAIVVNEEVSKLEYIWTTSENIPETGWAQEDVSSIQVNSDINLNTEVSEEETYYLYLRVTDLAGNLLETRTKGFIVSESAITLILDKTEATNEDINVTVSYGDELTQNRKAGISGKTISADSTKVIVTENGLVYAEATDESGNKVYTSKEITNIDKKAPEATVEYTTNEDGSITATITFDEETTITNNNGRNTYTFTQNGEFIFEFEDELGNKANKTVYITTIVKENEDPIVEDNTAPVITFNYTTLTTSINNPIGATITTNEDALISYSWDNTNWITSSGYVRSYAVTRTPTTAGTYILYAKAIDKSSNTSGVQQLRFTVVRTGEDIVNPEIIFEDVTTIQINGVKYVKVSDLMSTSNLIDKMNEDALCGVTPEYIKLMQDGSLKTGSEITINDEVKYIVVVNGDVNCDGKVSFLGDIILANNYRIGKINNLSIIQKLAADINANGEIDFIPDIIAMNNYRLEKINSL